MDGEVKLLFLHQGAIGDFLLSLSIVEQIQDELEADYVTAIASSPAARLAAGRSGPIYDAFAPDAVGLHTLFAESGPLDPRLSEQIATSAGVINFLGGPDHITHHRLVEACEGRVFSLDPRPSPETIAQRRHITASWIGLLADTELEFCDPDPATIDFPPDEYQDQEALPANGDAKLSPQAPGPQPPRRRLMIHPGSGGRAKCWPIERFIALADALPEVDVTWILGPVEQEDQNRFSALHQHRTAGRGEVLCEYDLVAAARAITQVDAYVGNDAGMSHVAAALGVPTVVIFGPTDPQVWRPLGDHVTVVATPKPGDAISLVELESVEAAVEAAL